MRLFPPDSSDVDADREEEEAVGEEQPLTLKGHFIPGCVHGTAEGEIDESSFVSERTNTDNNLEQNSGDAEGDAVMPRNRQGSDDETVFEETAEVNHEEIDINQEEKDKDQEKVALINLPAELSFKVRSQYPTGQREAGAISIYLRTHSRIYFQLIHSFIHPFYPCMARSCLSLMKSKPYTLLDYRFISSLSLAVRVPSYPAFMVPWFSALLRSSFSPLSILIVFSTNWPRIPTPSLSSKDP